MIKNLSSFFDGLLAPGFDKKTALWYTVQDEYNGGDRNDER